MRAAPGAPHVDGDSLASLAGDVADALGTAIPAWRLQLGDAVERWRASHVQTGVLERALLLPTAPDVAALLATFERAVQQLAALEEQAAMLDGSLVGHAIFRDPARVREAAALVAATRARSVRPPTAMPSGEHWVLAWPDTGDLLTGVLA